MRRGRGREEVEGANYTGYRRVFCGSWAFSAKISDLLRFCAKSVPPTYCNLEEKAKDQQNLHTKTTANLAPFIPFSWVHTKGVMQQYVKNS